MHPGTKARPRDLAKSACEVRIGDIGAILAAGLQDFAAAPVQSVAIASVYTLGGWLIAANLIVFDLPYLVYPLAMGFALVAPFVAVAFYDVSRTLGSGGSPSLAGALRSVKAAAHSELRWMALITAFAFFIWMDIAAMLTLTFFGASALDPEAFLSELLTTERGWVFIVVGHVTGAAIALLVFSISAVSFPMLFDRPVDLFTAIGTSVALVKRNSVAMALWCAIIVAAMVAALASLLLLLPIVLPVLGYASWHLYRRAVRPAESFTSGECRAEG
jgi:uncharacterized membrane protein